MTSHANCTHEKTKAARAACRAGKAQPDGTPARTAAERLADKAAQAASKVSKPHSHEGDPVVRHGNICGPCGNGSHDRCPQGGRQWYCTCREADHTL